MSELAQSATKWAESYRSESVDVSVDKNYWEDGFSAPITLIKIQPVSLMLPLLELQIQDNLIGYTLENWGRVSKRLNFRSCKNDYYAAAFVEMGACDTSLIQEMLQKIMDGAFVLNADSFNGHLASTGALIIAGSALTGPSSIWSAAKLINLHQKSELQYEAHTCRSPQTVPWHIKSV